MQLSKNFTLEQMVFSPTAIRKRIINNPNETEIENLKNLCLKVLEPILKAIGKKKLILQSGYRCEALNRAIGGAKKSQHIQGKAADINVEGMTPKQLFTLIRITLGAYDQCIVEFDSWVHISWDGINNRSMDLIAKKDQNGKTIYLAA